VVWHGFTQMAAFASFEPVVVERAEGCWLVDVDGRRYLDAISSLWVTTLGHRHPDLDRAVVSQLEKVAHSTMLGNSNTATVELAEALAKRVPVDEPHFLFASDGASAVEQALKIAFQYWVNLGARRRHGYLALGDAYHGDTVGSLSLGAKGFGTEIFDPLRFPVVRTPGYADPNWLDKAVSAIREHAGRLAAVVLEPLVQGAAGMLVADPADVARLVEEAKAVGLLVVADEVATGFGRTGALFASEVCGIRPDLMCLGKGITGGYLPMSATVASGAVYEAFLGEDLGPKTFYHGHSYGGNALASAVALAHLQAVERDRVLENVRARGEQLGRLLEERLLGGALRAHVRDVRRRGLMAGVELVAPHDNSHDDPHEEGLFARRVCAEAVRRGVLLRPLGDVVVLMPPLVVSADEVEIAVSVLEQSLAEVVARQRPGTKPATKPVPGEAKQPVPGEAKEVASEEAKQPVPGEAKQAAWGRVSGPRPEGAKRPWTTEVKRRLDEIETAGRWRKPRAFDAVGPEGVLVDEGKKVVAFASNDYLGLSSHPAVRAAAHEAIERFGTGAGASRLVTGTRPLHVELEEELADWKGAEKATLFSSGFAANLGVLGTVGGRGVLVCSDELNHASIVDGARLSRSEVRVYEHCDTEHLAGLLGAWSGMAVVVSDLVFSMDGDMAPVAELAEVCRRTGALLVLDEAHGVLAPDLRSELEGVEVLRVGTLSKTLGSLGGFVAGSRPMVELVENTARSYIFTTALSPADSAAALGALRVLRSKEGAVLLARLASYASRVREAVAPGGEEGVHRASVLSPIVPVVLGSEERALGVSAALLDEGIFVPAIRPPSVPEGTSRLRVTLSAAHSDVQVDALATALRRVLKG